MPDTLPRLSELQSAPEWSAMDFNERLSVYDQWQGDVKAKAEDDGLEGSDQEMLHSWLENQRGYIEIEKATADPEGTILDSVSRGLLNTESALRVQQAKQEVDQMEATSTMLNSVKLKVRPGDAIYKGRPDLLPEGTPARLLFGSSEAGVYAVPPDTPQTSSPEDFISQQKEPYHTRAQALKDATEQAIEAGDLAASLPTAKPVREFMEADGFSESAGELFRNFLPIAAHTLAESAPSIIAPVAGAAMGGAKGGPVGSAAGGAAGGFSMEYVNSYRDFLTEAADEAGIDAETPEGLVEALRTPQITEIAKERAVKRGVPIAAVDAMTAGLGGLLAKKFGTRAAMNLTVDPAGGYAGEIAAQAASGQDVSQKEGVLEAIGQAATGVGMTATDAVGTAAEQAPAQAQPENAPESASEASQVESDIVQVNTPETQQEGAQEQSREFPGNATLPERESVGERIPDMPEESTKDFLTRRLDEMGVAREDATDAQMQALNAERHSASSPVRDALDLPLGSQVQSSDGQVWTKEGFGDNEWFTDDGKSLMSAEHRLAGGTIIRRGSQNAQESPDSSQQVVENATSEQGQVKATVPIDPETQTADIPQPTEQPAATPDGQNFGPGAANVDEPLNNVPEGYAESATYDTLKDASERGDFAPGLEDSLPMLYETESRQQWVDEAAVEMAAEGETAAVTSTLKAFSDGRPKPKDVAKAMLLSKNFELKRKAAEAAGDTAAAQQFTDKQEQLFDAYLSTSTDTARLLNAGYFIRHLTPEGQIRAVMKTANRVGRRVRQQQQGEDAKIEATAAETIKQTQPESKPGEPNTPEAADAGHDASVEAAEQSVDDIVQALADDVARIHSDTPDLDVTTQKQLSDLQQFLSMSRRHSMGRDVWTPEGFTEAGNALGVAPDVLSNLWNSVRKGHADSQANTRTRQHMRQQERAAQKAEALVESITDDISDTPKMRRKPDSKRSFFQRVSSLARGSQEQFADRADFDTQGKALGIPKDILNRLWNAATLSNRNAQALVDLRKSMAQQDQDAARIDTALEKVLDVVSDTPNLRENAKRADRALDGFLRDYRSHARGTEKFADQATFMDRAKAAGVPADKAQSLWNAMSKAHKDAQTANSIIADQKAQQKKRRQKFVEALERQFGKARVNKMLRKKATMIDALLAGERPAKVVEDFYEKIDLTPDQRTQVLDILERAEKAEGAIQASILDEAKTILSEAMPAPYADAILDGWRAGLFSGVGTHLIAWMSGVENTMANFVGNLVTDIAKAKGEGWNFGRTKSSLRGIKDKSTYARAKVAVEAILRDLPIDDNVSRFGSGNALASMQKRGDVPWMLTPWLMQHYVYRGMGVPDHTIKSIVFRSEAGVLAYESAIEQGMTPEQANQAVIDQYKLFAKEQWDADILSAEAEYEAAMGASPTTTKEKALVRLRALEKMEARVNPDIQQAALDRGSEFNYMAPQPDDFLGRVAKNFMAMMNTGISTRHGEARPLRFLTPAINVMFNSLRVSTEYAGAGYFAGHSTALSYERQKLALNRAKAGTAITLSAMALAALSDSLEDDDGEGPFRFRFHGHGPKDKDVKNAMMGMGWKPYSIEMRLPGQKKSVYKRFGEGPMVLPFALIGNASDAERYGDVEVEQFTDWAKTLGPAVADTFTVLGEVGPAKTISDSASLLSFEESYGSTGLEKMMDMVTNLATTLAVPFSSAGRDVSNMIDPRITNKAELLGNAREMVPGTKGMGEVVIDQFGQEVERSRVKAVDRFVSAENADDRTVQLLTENGIALDSLVRSGTRQTGFKPSNATQAQEDVYELWIKRGEPARMSRQQYTSYFKEHRQALKGFLDDNVTRMEYMDTATMNNFVNRAKGIFSNATKLRMMNSTLADEYVRTKTRALLAAPAD